MRFIRPFFFFSILFFVIIYALNITVDPYEKFNINLWGVKTKAVSSFMNNKFHQIENTAIDYELFILGSSRVQRFDPDHLKVLTGLKSYNYGVNNARPEGLLAITRHVIDRHAPKVLLLQLDFYGLNKAFETNSVLLNSPLKEYLDKTHLDDQSQDYSRLFYRTYLTLPALGDSIDVLYKNYTGAIKITHRDDGKYTDMVPKKEIRLIKEYFINEYRDYSLDDQRIRYLKEIKDICKTNDVDLFVSISPMNEEHLMRIYHDKALYREFLAFKRAVVKIFDEVYDFNTPDAFRFAYGYWNDAVHPTEKFSNIMSDLIFTGKNDEGFGVIVNGDTIEAHIKKVDAELSALGQ